MYKVYQIIEHPIALRVQVCLSIRTLSSDTLGAHEQVPLSEKSLHLVTSPRNYKVPSDLVCLCVLVASDLTFLSFAFFKTMEMLLYPPSNYY